MLEACSAADLWAHQPELLSYARRRAGEQAEDLVQDTYVIALTRIDDYLGYGARPWLFSLLRGRLRNFSGAPQSLRLSDLPDQPGKDSPEAEAIANEVIKWCLRCLPAKLARVLKVIYLDGYSYEEAAQCLGVSRGVLNYQVDRARKTLRTCIVKEQLS